jgi:hypothetical protein
LRRFLSSEAHPYGLFPRRAIGPIKPRHRNNDIAFCSPLRYN